MAEKMRFRRELVLGLAAAASLLELGPLAGLLASGAGILPFLLAGLAYQIGNAAPRPAILTGRWVVGATAAGAAALLWLFPPAAPAWLAGIALMSWALQVIRRSVTAGGGGDLPTTAQKRTARVVGFIVATLVPEAVWLGGILAAMAVVLPTMAAPTARRDSHPAVERRAVHPLEWTMLVHQIHYFTYAYAIPLLVVDSIPDGIPLMGVWFACGWISYLSAESLWKRWPPRVVFAIGHVSLTTVLVLMFWYSHVHWAMLLLWVLSGFGGGTVYCLTDLHRREGLAHERLERAEDAGHLAGVAVALSGVLLMDWGAATLPAAGAFWAALAAGAMLVMLALRGLSAGAIGGKRADR